jgi:CBS domain-containing protein
MLAADVMTTEVITVDPDTSVQALAALLSERGISGVPVVDADNRVVGIVSKGDLLPGLSAPPFCGGAHGTDRRNSR